METLDAALVTQAAATGQAPTYLLVMGPWNGQYVRLANSDAAVTFGGNTYAARPWSVGAIEASQQGSDEKLTLVVAQPDLAFTALCAAADPAGVPVAVYRVFLDNLAVGMEMADGVQVDGYRLTDTEARFGLVPAVTQGRDSIPGRSVMRSCGWLYKGTECTYAGAEPEGETTCDHSNEACKLRNNFDHFGGFLFTIPQDWGA